MNIVANQPPWFYALSSVAQRARLHAQAIRHMDKGGAPKMLAFKILILYLARAFKTATGRDAKATWNEHKHRWEGNFVNLVESILPSAQRYCVVATDRALRCPAKQKARGKYIYDLTRAGTSRNLDRRAMSRTSD